MNPHSRAIRLFVSSTFSDMKAERDLLQRAVFPKLKQLCLSKGLRFQAIDLRWGVSEEAGRHNRTMRICLRELARCQHGTPKPNFLVLLGDRYGWRPLPETIRADLFERLKPWVESDSPQAAAALRWYRRDDNAMPAEYILQPREGTVADYDAWCREVERPLLAAMERAAARLLADASLSAEERNVLETSIGLSATHQEILHGALRVEDACEHVHAFVRSIRCVPAQTPHMEFVDRLPDGGEDIKSKRRLDGLRNELQRHLGADNFHRYAVDWREAGSFTDDDLRPFAEDVYRALEMVVLAQIAKLETIAPEVQEEQAHQDFGAERRDGFVGRKEPLRRIADYLADETGRPLTIFGVAGSGKSALMAKAVTDYESRVTNHVVIERYIGATPRSSDIISLLRNIIGTIRRQYPKQSETGVPPVSGDATPSSSSGEISGAREQPAEPSDSEIPFEMAPLSAAFRDAFGRATTEKPLVLFLDALDQLSETQNAHQLYWLPATLPANVHLVVSAALPAKGGSGVPPLNLESVSPVQNPDFSRSDSEASNAEPPKGGTPTPDPRASLCRALEAITLPEDRVVLDKLEPENGEKLLHRWLDLEGRTLQPAQRSAILNDFAHDRNPLWLRTAAAEAARLASWETPSALPKDTPSLMRQVLHRLSAEENHGAMLVNRALSYLACARHGLAEDELLDVLSQNKDVMTAVIRRSPTERVKPEADQIKSLPAAVWVALRGDIARYLGEHEAQGAMLMCFYHQSFREAVEVEFLRGRTDRRNRHIYLADYFRFRADPLGDESWQAPDGRSLREVIFHLIHGGKDQAAQRLLICLAYLDGRVSLSRDIYDLLQEYEELSKTARSPLEEWHRFVHRHAARLIKYPRSLLTIASLEGSSQILAAARQMADSGRWCRPWISTCRIPGSPPLPAGIRIIDGPAIDVIAESESRTGPAAAIAPDTGVAFVATGTNSIRMIDLLGRRDDVVMPCSECAPHYLGINASEDLLAAITADGTAVVNLCDKQEGLAAWRLWPITRFKCYLPPFRDPTVVLHGSLVVYRPADEIGLALLNCGEGSHADALPHTFAKVIGTNPTALAAVNETLVVLDDLEAGTLVATYSFPELQLLGTADVSLKYLQVRHLQGMTFAASFVDGSLRIYQAKPKVHCVAQTIHALPVAEVGCSRSPGAVLFVDSHGQLWEWQWKAGLVPEPVENDHHLVEPLGLALRRDGSHVLLTRNRRLHFRLSRREAGPIAEEIADITDSPNQCLLLTRNKEGFRLTTPARDWAVAVGGNDDMPMAIGHGDSDWLLVINRQGRQGLLVGLQAHGHREITFPAQVTSVGKATESGFWLSTAARHVLRVDFQGVVYSYDISQHLPSSQPSWTRIFVHGNLVVWCGRCVCEVGISTEDSYVILFFRYSQENHGLRFLGQRIGIGRGAFLVDLVYVAAWQKLVILWGGPTCPLVTVGSVADFSEQKEAWTELKDVDERPRALVVDSVGQIAHVLGDDAIFWLDATRWALLAVQPSSVPITATSRRLSEDGRVSVVLGGKEVVQCRLMLP